jgi:hypothetical protein
MINFKVHVIISVIPRSYSVLWMGIHYILVLDSTRILSLYRYVVRED